MTRIDAPVKTYWLAELTDMRGWYAIDRADAVNAGPGGVVTCDASRARRFDTKDACLAYIGSVHGLAPTEHADMPARRL